MDLLAGSKYFAYLGFDSERMIEPGVAVEVDNAPMTRLIQTDKGIYKPGELGRVRPEFFNWFTNPPTVIFWKEGKKIFFYFICWL